MAWRPAYSLQTLKSQLDATYPGWLFLGFIGDQSHASVPSDHNPNPAGVVCALDIGPGGGLDIHKLADNLLANRHPDLKYIISNRRIGGSHTGWKWVPYGGSDPHGTHIHISVGVGPDGQSQQPYDDKIKWSIMGKGNNDMTRDQAYESALLARTGIGFVSVAEANTHAEDDANHILADPGYLGALMKQLKAGQNWSKASDWFAHGDQYVKDSYNKGVADSGNPKVIVNGQEYIKK